MREVAWTEVFDNPNVKCELAFEFLDDLILLGLDHDKDDVYECDPSRQCVKLNTRGTHKLLQYLIKMVDKANPSIPYSGSYISSVRTDMHEDSEGNPLVLFTLTSTQVGGN